MAFSAWGRAGRYAVDGALLSSQIGFCCGYLVYITETVGDSVGFTKTQVLVCLLPLLIFLTMVPDLSKLAFFSLVAQFANLLAFLVVFWFDFEHLHLLQALKEREEFNWGGLLGFFSVAIYCYEVSLHFLLLFYLLF